MILKRKKRSHEQKSSRNHMKMESVIFVKKNLKINIWKIKNIVKLEIIWICKLKYRAPKDISGAYHNGSNYDYNFIIKELAEEFEKQFTCLG